MSVIYEKKSKQVGGQVVCLFVERVVVLFQTVSANDKQ